MSSPLVLVGRSSSHFTRVTRLFAAELGIELRLQVVPDLASLEIGDYGGNPALRLPTLRTPEGDWYGSLGICRELWRRAGSTLRVTWPEMLSTPLLANAQELVTQAMSSEVALIMARAAGTPAAALSKQEKSLHNQLDWLEANVDPVLAALPSERELSYLEATLFCLVAHLEFRAVLPLDPYPRLQCARARFGERASARRTEFHFD